MARVKSCTRSVFSRKLVVVNSYVVFVGSYCVVKWVRKSIRTRVKMVGP